jgi:predicted GNAT family acetyltransferase
MIDVQDVPDRNRYEVTLDGEVVGLLDYRRDAQGAVHLTHAEVSPRVGGQGIGTQLVQAALDDLAEKGERVVPVCSFVRAFVRDNPAYQRLVA